METSKLDSGWLRKAKHVAKKNTTKSRYIQNKSQLAKLNINVSILSMHNPGEGNLGLMATLCMSRSSESSWCPKGMDMDHRVRQNVCWYVTIQYPKTCLNKRQSQTVSEDKVPQIHFFIPDY